MNDENDNILFDNVIHILNDNRQYYHFRTIMLALEFLISHLQGYQENNCLNQKPLSLGIDAAVGNGKSYVARCLWFLFNSQNNFNFQDKIPNMKADLDKFNQIIKKYSADSQWNCIYISVDEFDYDYSVENILKNIYNILLDSIQNKVISVKDDYDEKKLTEITEVIKNGLKNISLSVLKKVGVDDSIVVVSDFYKALKDISDRDDLKNKFNIENQKLISDFKENFDSIIQYLKNKKIFFIVDNIDRCSPRFVVPFLENIKYLFLGNNIPFLFMIDYEYFKNLSEGHYGSTTDLSFFYNHIFSEVHKLYLKPKDLFIIDYINWQSANCLKKIYIATMRSNIDYFNKNLRLSLREIEIVMRKLNRFLDRNSFMVFDESTDAKRSVYSEMNFESMIFMIYILLCLQIHDIKSFNMILYEEIDVQYFVKDVMNNGHSKRYIYFLEENMNNIFMENKRLNSFVSTYIFNKNGKMVKIPNLELISFECKDNIVRVLGKKEKKCFEECMKENFFLSHLFNLEDILFNDPVELMNMTIKEYLRYKISQV